MIITSNAEKQNVAIELETKVSQAQIQQDVIINKARAEAQANVQRATASAQSFKDVQVKEAEAYAGLKTGLGMSNAQLLNYIEGQTISKFNSDGLIIGVPGLNE